MWNRGGVNLLTSPLTKPWIRSRWRPDEGSLGAVVGALRERPTHRHLPPPPPPPEILSVRGRLSATAGSLTGASGLRWTLRTGAA